MSDEKKDAPKKATSSQAKDDAALLISMLAGKSGLDEKRVLAALRFAAQEKI